MPIKLVADRDPMSADHRYGHNAPLKKICSQTNLQSNEARARAEVSFRQEEQAKEGTKAMMEYQANSRIIREKTIECASIGPDGFSLKSGEHTGAVCGWL
jgi:hypothetical protein